MVGRRHLQRSIDSSDYKNFILGRRSSSASPIAPRGDPKDRDVNRRGRSGPARAGCVARVALFELG